MTPKHKKIIKWSLISILGTAFILFAILVVHIYIATHRPAGSEPVLQLARIDFKEHIDSAKANKIQSFVSSLTGVKNTYFNISNGTLVYTYTSGTQNAASVYGQLIAHGGYKAERYIVDAETAANTGCPAFEKQSMQGALVRFIASL